MKELYPSYARRYYWTHSYAAALSYGLNPEMLELETPEYVQLFYPEAGSPLETYHQYLEEMEALMLDAYNAKVSGFDEEKVNSLKYIDWCRKMDLPFPEELEKLVRKYHKPIPDWESKYNNLKNESDNKDIEIVNLTQKINSIPTTKRAVSWQKGFIGVLAMKYTREALRNNFGDNQAIYKKTTNNNPKLTLATIINDLDHQGINLDDGTIKTLILESIQHLKEPKK